MTIEEPGATRAAVLPSLVGEASGVELVRRVAVLAFGLIQALVVLRVVLLLLDAQTSNALVSGILNLSQIFVGPFEAILKTNALSAAGPGLDLVAFVAFVGWTVLEFATFALIDLVRRETAEGGSPYRLGGHVAGERSSIEELTRAGIAMADAPRALPAEMRLVAVGPGHEPDDVAAERVDFNAGLKVVYAKFAGTAFALDGEDLPILSHRDIVAVVAGGGRQAGRTLPSPWAAPRRRDRRALSATPTIRRLGPGDDGLVLEAAVLFDHRPEVGATERFLRSGDHHLLVAYLGNEPAGFVTGVELTHPDKGTEMFLYELGVAEPFRRRGIGTALVSALKDLAIDLGCIDMWVLTDARNDCGLATYRSAGGRASEPTEMLTWDLRQPAAAVP